MVATRRSGRLAGTEHETAAVFHVWSFAKLPELLDSIPIGLHEGGDRRYVRRYI